MKLIFITIVSFLHITCFAQAKTDDLIILLDGKIQKTFTIDEIKKFKPSMAEYYDYTLRKSENYKGVPFFTLINLAVPDLKKVAEVELISKNGYKAYFPLESFYKLDAILTYESETGKFERFSKKDKQMVSLGPYYLVWDYKSNAKEDKYRYSSAYQIISINLITNVVDFGVNNVKDNESVNLGYRTYKRYCLSCHAIDSWGGNISMDLVKKKTLQTKGSDFIMKHVFDSNVQSPHQQMVFLPKYKNSDEMAKGVIEFLNFSNDPTAYMKDKKIDSDKVRYDSYKKIIDEMKVK